MLSFQSAFWHTPICPTNSPSNSPVDFLNSPYCILDNLLMPKGEIKSWSLSHKYKDLKLSVSETNKSHYKRRQNIFC